MFRSLCNSIIPLVPIALGQTTLSANELGTWLLSAAAVAVLVNQVAAALQRFRKKPVSMEVSENCVLLHAPIVQRIDSLERNQADHHGDMNNRLHGVSKSFTSLRQEIKSDLREMKREMHDSDRNQHLRTNDIVTAVNQLKGAFEQSQRRGAS